MMHRPWMIRNQQGFTLTETIAAVGFLAMGLVGLLAAMGHGTTSVDSARRGTTAVFLAEQKMEEVKAFALGDATGRGWLNLADVKSPAEEVYCSPGTPPANCPIPGYPDYRRTVTVTNNPNGLLATKQIEVQVFYWPVGGDAETSVAVSTLVVQR
jgi:type II secretory pathway pseudopilin PulG